MATTKPTTALVDEMLEIVEHDPKALSPRMREALVLYLIRQEEISAAHGAELLGMEVEEFADLMEAHGMTVFTDPSLPHITSLPKSKRPRLPKRTRAIIGLQQQAYITMREAANLLGQSYGEYLEFLGHSGYPVSKGGGDPELIAALAHPSRR